jgi:subfamily B ATP-binding cassette protein MsbA
MAVMLGNRAILNFLKQRLLEQKRWILASFVFAGLTVSIQILQNNLAKNYFDQALNIKDLSALTQICVALIGYFLIEGLVTYFHRFFLRYGTENMVRNLRKEVFDRFLVMSQAQYANYTSGKAVNHTISDVMVISQGLHIIADLIQSPLTILGMLGYLFYLNWKLTIVCFAAIPLVGLVGKVLGSSARRNQGRIQSVLESLSNHIIESIRGLRTAHAFNQTPRLKKEFSDRIDESFRHYVKLAKIEEIVAPLTKWVTSWIGAALLGVGGYLVIADAPRALAGDPRAFTSGALIAYLMAAGRIQQPLRQLNQVNVRLQQVLAASARIYEVLTQKLDPVGEAQAALIKKEARQNFQYSKQDLVLEYRDVSFRYPSREDGNISENPLALSKISFRLNMGEKIALVGRSGSGKSTLSLLAMRFLDPSEGQILLAGRPLPNWSIEELRAHFSYVSQDVYLFNRSLRENLLFAKSDANDSEIWNALEKAHIEDFVRSLPKGLDTQTGEFASTLSGGEKQRIAIARAFLRDSPFLILDEATSQLDAHAEAAVQKALDQLLEGRASIIIAHRLTTVRESHRVLVMDKGRIIEEGSPKDLISNASGAFAELWKTQVEGVSSIGS